MKGYTYAALASLMAIAMLTSVAPARAQLDETEFDLMALPLLVFHS